MIDWIIGELRWLFARSPVSVPPILIFAWIAYRERANRRTAAAISSLQEQISAMKRRDH